MNGINGINNISSFNQISSPVFRRNFNSAVEIPQDNVNINNQNIKNLIERIISDYLNNANNANVGNSTPQNGGYSSLSDDELLRLLLLLLQYVNQNGNNGNIGNNPGYKPDSIGNSPVSSAGGNFGAPYAPINRNTKVKVEPGSANNANNQVSNQGSANNQVSNQGNVNNQVSNSDTNQVSNSNQIGTNNKVDLSAYSPEEREKIQRFLDRANDAYNNPEKYTNPNNGRTARDGSQWDMWCLGFVNNMAERKDAALLAPSAKESLQKIKEQGRLRKDWENMPPGSYVYWGGGQYGHIAIYTGEKNEKGEPIILTTGWNGFNGLHKVPLSELQRRLGAPEGFATPKL